MIARVTRHDLTTLQILRRVMMPTIREIFKRQRLPILHILYTLGGSEVCPSFILTFTYLVQPPRVLDVFRKFYTRPLILRAARVTFLGRKLRLYTCYYIYFAAKKLSEILSFTKLLAEKL